MQSSDPDVTVTQDPPAGTLLGLGTNLLTFTATDTNGLSSTCTAIVTVVDVLPPVLACATNKVVECGSTWDFDEPVASDACSGTNVTVSVLDTVTNGLLFTRTWVAMDPVGNTNTCSQTVTLVDTLPPVLVCATNKTVECGMAWDFDELVFSDTTVLRAAAYRTAYVPSVITHTYVFPNKVAYQSGAGFPTNWGFTDLGAVPAYYTCNSNLVNIPQWGSQMPDALLSVPTLSLVMNPDDMFGTNGIYSNTFGDGDAWERACSVEYFRPDLKPGFQIDCGIRIQGQLSRDPEFTPKHSFRLLFKQMYGAGKLRFDLYPGSPVQDFDGLELHASLGDHWFGVGATAQMHRDQWCADTQQEMGGYGTHGTYVHVYINGLYWGLYNIGERPDASYAASYLGGKKSDYDSFNAVQLIDGTTNALNDLLTLAQAGITNEVTWSNLCHSFDVPTFVDYLMMNWYVINVDWLYHNYWLDGSVSHGIPFHIINWDSEETFDVFRFIPIDYDIIGLTAASTGPSGILYDALHDYPEFRRIFGDHAQELLYGNGALTPGRTAARWMKRAQEIDSAIIGESLRWGITNWWATNVWGADWKLYTRNDWLVEQNYQLTHWFPVRTGILIGQLRNVGLYPALDAPTLSPYGGIIAGALPVTITIPAGAVLYWTTNGTDPRLPDGTVSPDAFSYPGPTLTLTLTNSCQLGARSFATNTWSALAQAKYALRSEVDLRISSIAPRSDGAIKVDLLAWPEVSYTLRASTTLRSSANDPGWEPIASVAPFPDGTFSFLDTAATNHPARFYILTWP